MRVGYRFYGSAGAGGQRHFFLGMLLEISRKQVYICMFNYNSIKEKKKKPKYEVMCPVNTPIYAYKSCRGETNKHMTIGESI